MPARDRYHDAVRNALVKDGWTITNDPLHLKWGHKDMYVDLGATRLLAAVYMIIFNPEKEVIVQWIP